MRFDWLGTAAVAIACGGATRSELPSHALVPADPPPAAPAVSREIRLPERADALVEAEPFSATWNDSEQDEAPAGPAPEAWENADTCPAPLESFAGLYEYDAFVGRVLGVLDTPDQLATLRISPSFQPERAVILMRSSNGGFVARTVRLKEQVWNQMMKEMQAQQGGSVSLDDSYQRAALARVTAAQEVHERQVDTATAWLWIALWQALIARAQVVEEIGIVTGKFDGTLFQFRRGGHGAVAHSPDHRGVLAEATLAAELIEGVVNGSSTDAAGDLRRARELMHSALVRTQNKESCLRLYDGTHD